MDRNSQIWAAAMTAYSVLERALGKTKHGSLIGLLGNLFLWIFKRPIDSVPSFDKPAAKVATLEEPMSEEKVGSKNITELVDFGLDVVNLGIAIGADGKISADDLPKVAGAVPGLIASGVPAFSDLPMVKDEAIDWSHEEGAALLVHVMGKVALAEGPAKLVTEKALKLALAIVELAQAIVAAKAPVA